MRLDSQWIHHVRYYCGRRLIATWQGIHWAHIIVNILTTYLTLLAVILRLFSNRRLQPLHCLLHNSLVDLILH